MQTQIAFYDCFYFYVQPVYFTAIISEKFRMRKYHFREFPLQIWQKRIDKIWIDREKARPDKKRMKRKGFFLSTIRISLSNSTIIYLLQPIRSAYKNTEIVRGAKTKGWERWRRSFLPSLTLTILISNHNYDITVTLIFNQ